MIDNERERRAKQSRHRPDKSKAVSYDKVAIEMFKEGSGAYPEFEAIKDNPRFKVPIQRNKNGMAMSSNIHPRSTD